MLVLVGCQPQLLLICSSVILENMYCRKKEKKQYTCFYVTAQLKIEAAAYLQAKGLFLPQLRYPARMTIMRKAVLPSAEVPSPLLAPALLQLAKTHLLLYLDIIPSVSIGTGPLPFRPL